MKINLLKKAGLAIVLASSTISLGQEILTGNDAMALFPNAQVVRTGTHSSAPSFVKFFKGQEIDFDQLKSWTKKNFRMDSGVDFVLMGTENDQLGHKHYKYQQTYNGLPIEYGIWIAHTFQDKVYSMNGLVFPSLSVASNASMSVSSALEYAKNYVGANQYKWEMPAEEAHLKREQNDPFATYYPEGELVYVSQNGSFTPNSYRLAYKFNIYAHQPLSRSEIYVDVTNGQVIFENVILSNIDVIGTAQTAYSGVQSITADSFSGQYRLRETQRGNGINTYDMNQGTVYGNAVDFIDDDNVWSNANADLDEYATDAHWGAEMTYDYLWFQHSRNSIDGSGFALNSYVHYDVLYANAFWDGQRMTYGDGNGTTWNPLTAIDIAAHEITHGLNSNTANLIYNAESGALNESFCDIFGTAVENFALPTNWDWLVGEDIGAPLRSLSDPNSFGDPDTYFGNNWASLTGGDNGGVHTNSSVQNYWFYLMVAGGTGTNDNADNYTVNPIGFTEGGQVAFRNLTVYLTPSSNFADARFYGIQSAVDLFGGCTSQVETVTNAWYAVGVGPEYVATVVADMNAGVTSACQAPFTADFNNLSLNGTTFEWDFGDGNTSTLLNPSNTYNSTGLYTITLIADGGSCGIDTVVWVDYIDVDTANPCIITMPGGGSGPVQTTCSGLLYDSGGPTSNYGANEDAQITISPLGASTVDLTFNFFDIEPGQSGTCNYDWVRVYDGPSTASPLIDTYCNNNIPPGVVSSTGPDVTIVFHSDPGLELAGYEIQWDCVLSVLPPTVDFTSSTDTTCNGEVNFTDISTNGPTSWAWDFGDGGTSNQQNPVYDYSTSGLYTVKLVASNLNGADSAIYTDMIFVDLPPSPSGVADNICANNIANLSASGGGGNLDWYDAVTGGSFLFSGSAYSTPSLSTTTSYWVEEDIPGAIQSLGPVDNTFGTGAFFNGDQYLIFDVTSPVTLTTVRVYANGDANRFIELRNSSGVVVESATVFIPDGESVITLNFPLNIGTNWQLGTQNGSGQDLFRNDAGPTYPYIVSGGEVIITTSSPGTGYYYFFYDWQIESPGCTSERTEVIATVNPNSDATIDSIAPMCSSDSPITLNAVEAGGTWSGNGVSGTTFDPSTAGNGSHTITYTIAGTCGDTDTEIIVVADSYDATINATSILCDGDTSAILTAVDAGGTWTGTGITNGSTGEFNPSIAGVGTHTITYSIAGSCGDSDTEDIIVEATADATINAAGPFCRNETNFMMTAAQTGGTWSADCGACINSTTGQFDPMTAGSGVWIITYTIAGNCFASESIAVSVSECLGIGELENAISIFPNPTDGQFMIRFDEFMESNIIISDISGRIIFQGKYASEIINIDLTLYADGTYFLTILDADMQQVISEKIQIIK
jgi:Zn-dependent metalloprotease